MNSQSIQDIFSSLYSSHFDLLARSRSNENEVQERETLHEEVDTTSTFENRQFGLEIKPHTPLRELDSNINGQYVPSFQRMVEETQENIDPNPISEPNHFDLAPKAAKLNSGAVIQNPQPKTSSRGVNSLPNSTKTNTAPTTNPKGKSLPLKGGIKRNYNEYVASQPKQPATENKPGPRAFVSLKKQVDEFFTRRSSTALSPSKTNTKGPKLCKPMSPNLRTKTRYRPASQILSTEEMILQEIEARKQKRLKELEKSQARGSSKPLESEMSIESKGSLTPKGGRNEHFTEHKVTAFKPFNFELEKRSAIKSACNSVRKSTQDGKLTGTKTPVLRTAAKVTPHVMRTPGLNTEMKENPRLKQLQEQREREEKQLQEQRKFKATPIPDYAKLAKAGVNQHFKPLPVTKPIEIKFHTDQRATLKTSVTRDEVQDKGTKSVVKGLTAAKNPSSLKPKQTEVETIETVDAQNKSVEPQEQQPKAEEEEEIKANEEEDLKDLRRQLVFKATPMMGDLAML